MKNRILVLILLFSFLSLPITTINSQEPDPVIFLTFLTPDTVSERIMWSNVIAQELPEIGIEITLNNITNWANISTRLWSYPYVGYDYIPTYDQGGFDVFFLGLTKNFDWRPKLYYSAESFPSAYEENFYQYNDTQFEQILTEYNSETNLTVRIQKCKQLQSILYNDLPGIGITAPEVAYGFKVDVVGIDTKLLHYGSSRTHLWDDSSDHMITYLSPDNIQALNLFIDTEDNINKLWTNAISGSLFKRAQGTHILEPEIAENYTMTPVVGDTQYVFVNLDPNAKFSDGSPVLPSDVKYSYELIMTASIGSARYTEFTEFYFEDNSSIQIVGSDVPGGQLLFEIKDSDRWNLNALDAGIIDKSEVEPLVTTYGPSIFWEYAGTGNAGWSLVKSCGPFILNYINYTSEEVGLTPNPYWQDLIISGGSNALLSQLNITRVATKEDAFAKLLLGQADILSSLYKIPLTSYEGFAGFESRLSRLLVVQEMIINMKHPVIGTGELTPLGTAESARNIRHAISYSIPRDFIVSNLPNDSYYPSYTPTSFLVTDGIVGYDDSIVQHPYDLVQARTLMELAGYVDIINEYENIGFLLIIIVGLCALPFIRRKN